MNFSLDAVSVPPVHAYDCDSKQTLVRMPGLHNLNNAPEHSVVVLSRYIGERFVRKVAPVVIKRTGVPDKYYWADTITGSMYDLNGMCLSGPLEFVDTPVRTWRKVPDVKKRTQEAEQALIAAYDDYDEAAA